MKKKVIALMLVIPLLVMLTIFTVSKTASLSVEVPATGIQLASSNVDGAISLDMATYSDDYYFEAAVTPREAKNKGYTISIADENSEDACISVGSDGLVTLNRAGQATITATSNDKGFTTSLDVSVYSTKVYDMDISVHDESGASIAIDRTNGGDTTYTLSTESTGQRLDFDSIIYPSTLSGGDIEWTSSDDMGLEIDESSGIAECRLSGEYVVTATSHNAIKGDLTESVKVILEMPTGTTNIAVQGVNHSDKATLNVAPGLTKAKFLVESRAKLMREDVESDEAGFVVESMRTLRDTSPYVYELETSFGAMTEGEKLYFSLGEYGRENRFEVELSCADYIVDIATPKSDNIGKDVIYQKRGMSVTYSPLISPYAPKECHWEIDGDIADIEEIGSSCKVNAIKTGSATLTLVANIMGREYRESVRLEVVEHVTNPIFRYRANNGISKVNAITDTDIVDGAYVPYRDVLEMTCLVNGARQQIDISDFALVSSDENVLGVDESGGLDIVNSGVASISAEWRYGDYFGESITAKIPIKAVKNGVYVDSSSELLKASEDGANIVLDADIDFGIDMEIGEIQSLLDSHKYYTTYDWTYYANLDKDSASPTNNARPYVHYILELKKSLYGNGHIINMGAITKAYDGNNPRYFKGPLNFVAMANRASVKGQDNISFLVRSDGVTIDNVSLMGCGDEALIKNDKDGKPYLELSELNYVGTVLEIAGDNVNVQNSRISNGRNVVRIYGGGVDAEGSPIRRERLTYSEVKDERIHVNITSSILSHAREFILKEGTNRALLSETREDITKFETESLLDKAGKPFDHKDKFFDASDDDFYDNAVLTDVTLRDSVLDTSGLFAVGIESHFSGYFLTGEGDFKKQLRSYSWYDLASTSYASVLRLEGDVRLYDWKDISRVDSSTLIESEGGDKGEILSQVINLDIAKMIKKVGALATNPQYASYKDILTEYNGEQYVHGGIAFYGGGKNYSKIDMSSFTGTSFTKYDVNIRVIAVGEAADMNNSNYVQGTMLPCAAGEEDFTFYMYDRSSAFNYEKQLRDLECGDAYNWIKGV